MSQEKMDKPESEKSESLLEFEKDRDEIRIKAKKKIMDIMIGINRFPVPECILELDDTADSWFLKTENGSVLAVQDISNQIPRGEGERDYFGRVIGEKVEIPFSQQEKQEFAKFLKKRITSAEIVLKEEQEEADKEGEPHYSSPDIQASEDTIHELNKLLENLQL